MKFKAILLSLLIALMFIIGPLAIVINCFIFIDLLWLWITLIAIILIIFILLIVYFYRKFKAA